MANHSLNQLLSMEEDVNQAMLTVKSQASLPKQAATISANASTLVSQLLENISLTPEPDFAAIQNLTTYLESVSQQLSMADLEATQAALNSTLQNLDDELTELKNKLSASRQELEDLEQLSDTLPPNCDSDY